MPVRADISRDKLEQRHWVLRLSLLGAALSRLVHLFEWLIADFAVAEALIFQLCERLLIYRRFDFFITEHRAGCDVPSTYLAELCSAYTSVVLLPVEIVSASVLLLLLRPLSLGHYLVIGRSMHQVIDLFFLLGWSLAECRI